MKHMTFTTTPEWWLTLPNTLTRHFYAPDGEKVFASNTAKCVRREPYCYICGVPVHKTKLIKDEQGLWRIDQILTKNNVIFTKDHVVPKALGGSDTHKNYRTCCYTCNQFKGGAPHNTPVFCYGWIKLAISTNTTHLWRDTNTHPIYHPKRIPKQPTGYYRE